MRIINEKDNPKLFVVWDYLLYRNRGNKFLNSLYLIKNKSYSIVVQKIKKYCMRGNLTFLK